MLKSALRGIAAYRQRFDLMMGAAISPSRWLLFDGLDDLITLPAGEGDEPASGIFVEAWLLPGARDVAAARRTVISRGTQYNNGYSLGLSRTSLNNGLRLYFILNGPLGGGAYQEFLNASYDDGIPIHVAAGWDGSNVYYFIDGILVKRVTSDATPISYTGDSWSLGRDGGAASAYLKSNLSVVRVSNACRHTTSFTPEFSPSADANTVYLALCREGSGTILADSAHRHMGTFKAAGEPAWNGDASFSMYVNDLWTPLRAMVPNITGVDVYIQNFGGTYRIYQKIHATGPTWLRYDYWRDGAVLSMNHMYYTVPTGGDPDNPSTWPGETATRITNPAGSVHEYAISGQPAGGSSVWMGCGHGNEVLDSEQWGVDGTPVALPNLAWEHGAVITLTSNSHFTNPLLGVTNVADVIKIATWNRTLDYEHVDLQVTWNVATAVGGAYMGMLSDDIALFARATFRYGGTDYDVSSGAGEWGNIRSSTCALWNPANEYVAAVHFPDFPATALYCAVTERHRLLNQKIYCKRGLYVDDGAVGRTWNCDFRYAAWANCGNHFLKTT